MHFQGLIQESTVLPAISTRERGSDWVTDKVCEAARKKQEAWMR